VQEPFGGAHADPSWTSQQIKIAINENMNVGIVILLNVGCDLKGF
jgi:hypothetical protein